MSWDELVRAAKTALREQGYKYDPDLFLWYTEGTSQKNGSTVKVSIPPFGLTDKQLYDRLQELKDKEVR